ncbi:MAG: alpha/beta fold hydrolase [bacterium]
MYKFALFGSITLILLCLLASYSFSGAKEKPAFDKFDKKNVNIGELSINTRDNLILLVKYYISKNKENSPVVILLHMLGKDNSSWNKFIPLLLNNGYAVYSVDMRGHGKSVETLDKKSNYFQTMTDGNWLKMPDDVSDLINFISKDKTVDSSNIALIGASIGANSAIIAASEHPDKVKTTVALSPGLNYRGIEILKSAENLKTPILIATSQNDDYSYKSSNQLNKAVKVEHDLLIYEGNEHGTNLLNQSEELMSKIISWLNEHIEKK